MEIYEKHAKIRLGSMNLTVSMKSINVVEFEFCNVKGLHRSSNRNRNDGSGHNHGNHFNFGDNGHHHNNANFDQNGSDYEYELPEGMPLPKIAEQVLENLSEASQLLSINEVQQKVSVIKDICPKHPISIVIDSILASLRAGYYRFLWLKFKILII